jgi:hypothetical protein
MSAQDDTNCHDIFNIVSLPCFERLFFGGGREALFGIHK